ncbi:hypothetical protein VTN00DRAFT_5471 [Thermoascus crustaceus]|uniref:uncharacterized protein n=1 Tax=Thermoascus crustaceus TaxID=5088 RepID=UPI0037431B97
MENQSRSQPSKKEIKYPDPPPPREEYDLDLLPDPPDDFELCRIPLERHIKSRLWNTEELDKLIRFHFWGIKTKTNRRMTNEVRIKLLRKLNYYQSDIHRQLDIPAFVDFKRDAGPRLLRIDLNPPPKPLSRRYPKLPPLIVGQNGQVNTAHPSYLNRFSYSSSPIESVNVNNPNAHNAPIHNNTNLPIEQIQYPTTINPGAAGHPSTRSQQPHQSGVFLHLPIPEKIHPQTSFVDPAIPQRQNPPAFTETVQISNQLPPQRAATGSPQDPFANTQTLFEGTENGTENDNLWLSMDSEIPNVPSDEPQASDQTPPAESPRRPNPALTPRCSHKAIVEAVEKAIMQFAYSDLDRHPLALPRAARPYATATAERDLLKAISVMSAGTAYARLSPSSLTFDPHGYDCSFRGRGPVWRNNSCAIDCAIVAGRLLDAGSTIIDRGEDAMAWEEQLTELEKAFLDTLDMNWDVFPAQTSSDQRDRFWQVIARHMQGVAIGQSMSVTALWVEATKSFGQFKFSYTEEKTSCSCKGNRTRSSFITASAVTPPFCQTDIDGVRMETLLRRFFRHETPTDCRYCDKKGVVMTRRVFHNLPMRLVVQPHHEALPMNHTSNISFPYYDETGREQLATYRWLGGIYCARTVASDEDNGEQTVHHFRVYWTDAERGEVDNGEIRMYDGMRNLGLIVGNISPLHRDDRVPEPWWKDVAIPLLFYEQVLNPDENVLNVAQQAVQNMINIQKDNQLILNEHTPWSPQNPSTSGPRPLRVLTDTGSRRRRRFNTVSFAPPEETEVVYDANPALQRPMQRIQASQHFVPGLPPITIANNNNNNNNNNPRPNPVRERVNRKRQPSQSFTPMGPPPNLGSDNSQQSTTTSTSSHHTGMQTYAPAVPPQFPPSPSSSVSVQPRLTQITWDPSVFDPQLIIPTEEQAIAEKQANTITNNVQQRPRAQRGNQRRGFSGVRGQKQAPRRGRGGSRQQKAKTRPPSIVIPVDTQAPPPQQQVFQLQSFQEGQVDLPQVPLLAQDVVSGLVSAPETSQAAQTVTQPQFPREEQVLGSQKPFAAPSDALGLALQEFLASQGAPGYISQDGQDFLNPFPAQQDVSGLGNAAETSEASLKAVFQEIEELGRSMSRQNNRFEGEDNNNQPNGDFGSYHIPDDLDIQPPTIDPELLQPLNQTSEFEQGINLNDDDWLAQYSVPQPQTVEQSNQDEQPQQQEQQLEDKTEDTEQPPPSKKTQGKKRARDETEYEQEEYDDLSSEHSEKKLRLDTTNGHFVSALPTTREENQVEASKEILLVLVGRFGLVFILFTVVFLFVVILRLVTLMLILLLFTLVTVQQLNHFLETLEQAIIIRQFLQLQQFVPPLSTPVVVAQHFRSLPGIHPLNDIDHPALKGAIPLELFVHLMLQRIPPAQNDTLPDLAEHLEPVALRREAAKSVLPALRHDVLDGAVNGLHNVIGKVVLLPSGQVSDVQLLPHVPGVVVEVDDGVEGLLFLCADEEGFELVVELLDQAADGGRVCATAARGE